MNIAENNFLYMLGNFKQSYEIPSFTVKVDDEEHIISEYELRWIMLQVKKNILDGTTLQITCNTCGTVMNIRKDGCIDNDCVDSCNASLSINTRITLDMLKA